MGDFSRQESGQKSDKNRTKKIRQKKSDKKSD